MPEPAEAYDVFVTVRAREGQAPPTMDELRRCIVDVVGDVKGTTYTHHQGDVGAVLRAADKGAIARLDAEVVRRFGKSSAVVIEFDVADPAG